MYTFSNEIYLKWISPLISEKMLYDILKPIIEDKSNIGLTFDSSHKMADESSLRESLLPKLIINGLVANGYQMIEMIGVDSEAILMMYAMKIKMNIDNKKY